MPWWGREGVRRHGKPRRMAAGPAVIAAGGGGGCRGRRRARARGSVRVAWVTGCHGGAERGSADGGRAVGDGCGGWADALAACLARAVFPERAGGGAHDVDEWVECGVPAARGARDERLRSGDWRAAGGWAGAALYHADAGAGVVPGLEQHAACGGDVDDRSTAATDGERECHADNPGTLHRERDGGRWDG